MSRSFYQRFSVLIHEWFQSIRSLPPPVSWRQLWGLSTTSSPHLSQTSLDWLQVSAQSPHHASCLSVPPLKHTNVSDDTTAESHTTELLPHRTKNTHIWTTLILYTDRHMHPDGSHNVLYIMLRYNSYQLSQWHIWKLLKPNTHCRRRRDSTVELSRVGGVYWIRD